MLFVKGFQVVQGETDDRGQTKVKPVSRVFMVKAAAIQYLELARGSPPDVYVREVIGSDSKRPASIR